jgi:hypothetical protein
VVEGARLESVYAGVALRAGCRGLWAELRLRGGRPQGSLLCAAARDAEWFHDLSLRDE